MKFEHFQQIPRDALIPLMKTSLYSAGCEQVLQSNPNSLRSYHFHSLDAPLSDARDLRAQGTFLAIYVPLKAPLVFLPFFDFLTGVCFVEPNSTGPSDLRG